MWDFYIALQRLYCSNDFISLVQFLYGDICYSSHAHVLVCNVVQAVITFYYNGCFFLLPACAALAQGILQGHAAEAWETEAYNQCVLMLCRSSLSIWPAVCVI